MKVTEKFLKSKNACDEGVEWWLKDNEPDPIKVVMKLIAEDRLDWANWIICRVFNYPSIRIPVCYKMSSFYAF